MFFFVFTYATPTGDSPKLLGKGLNFARTADHTAELVGGNYRRQNPAASARNRTWLFGVMSLNATTAPWSVLAY